ncbi:uncharacterized protein TNCV_2538571 [Trichonephila clavipes]|nr:uncharacterized protein TNCV_2538571 [Trichonephila clavipes]
MRYIKEEAFVKIFCEVMNFSPSPKWFYDFTYSLNNATENVAKVSMALAAAETLSFNNGGPNVPVAIDGTWQKKGGLIFLNVVVTAVSLDTEKVVDAEILSRKCSCNFNSNVLCDKCSANYVVNSRGMEVEEAHALQRHAHKCKYSSLPRCAGRGELSVERDRQENFSLILRLSQKAYDRINAKIADISEALANASMKKAAAEEKLLIAPKNHSRSAGKMEVCGMQKMFLRSEQKHGLKYQRYIGDGDSKTFLSIAEKEPYGDSVPILGKTPKETYSMLVCVYEDQALSMKCVYEWFARFREDRVNASDNPRGERLLTSVNDESIEKMNKLITKYRRLTVRMITG